MPNALQTLDAQFLEMRVGACSHWRLISIVYSEPPDHTRRCPTRESLSFVKR